MRGFKDIGAKGHFSAKKGVLGQNPPWAGVTKFFLGQKNIKNEFSTIKLLRVQIFSKIWQLLKIAIIGGDFYILGAKMPPRVELEFFNSPLFLGKYSTSSGAFVPLP